MFPLPHRSPPRLHRHALRALLLATCVALTACGDGSSSAKAGSPREAIERAGITCARTDDSDWLGGAKRICETRDGRTVTVSEGADQPALRAYADSFGGYHRTKGKFFIGGDKELVDRVYNAL